MKEIIHYITIETAKPDRHDYLSYKIKFSNEEDISNLDHTALVLKLTSLFNELNIFKGEDATEREIALTEYIRQTIPDSEDNIGVCEIGKFVVFVEFDEINFTQDKQIFDSKSKAKYEEFRNDLAEYNGVFYPSEFDNVIYSKATENSKDFISREVVEKYAEFACFAKQISNTVSTEL